MGVGKQKISIVTDVCAHAHAAFSTVQSARAGQSAMAREEVRKAIALAQRGGETPSECSTRIRKI